MKNPCRPSEAIFQVYYLITSYRFVNCSDWRKIVFFAIIQGMKNTYSVFGRKSWKTISIIVGSMTVAFILGIQTAGDVRPVIGAISADGAMEGDFNSNGHLDLEDAEIALELASNYRTPTPEELEADPNRDYVITNEDVFTILERLKHTPSRPVVVY